MNALIGYTGFVGSNLNSQIFSDSHFYTDYQWDVYNSKNIEKIKGKTYNLVIHAGIPSVKWIANQAGGADFQNILNTFCLLETCNIKKLVIISTIDVFDEPEYTDEFDTLTSRQSYGINRGWLERKCSATFDTTIIRLPGLFGPNLKKNIIYDCLTNHRLPYIDVHGVYQWYPINRLWSDIKIALKHDLPILHLATEPINTSELLFRCFFEQPLDKVIGSLKPVSEAAYYNFITSYDHLFDGRAGYIMTKDEVINSIIEFRNEYIRNSKHSKS